MTFKLLDQPVDQAIVSFVNPVNFEAVVDTGAHHGADGCIHSGSVASGGQNAYFFYLGHDNFTLEVQK
jgi:hypothetical protein